MAKIMLVEDDNNLREIYAARLQAEGHEIVAAKDGEEALALAVKEKPDLIISDVMMPRISGFDMLDILRNAPETKNTKVIMMTALSQAEDKARADKLGADRYLVKSQVTLEDVARTVKDVLEGKPESHASISQAPVAAAEVAGNNSAPSAPASSQPTASSSDAAATSASPPTSTNPPAAVDESPSAAPVVDEPSKDAGQPNNDNTPEPTAAPQSPVAAEPTSNEQTPGEPPKTTDSETPGDTALAIENPAPKPEPAQDESPPATINVKLPTPPDELQPTATNTEPAASSTTPPKPIQETVVGPSLAEALADEEKSTHTKTDNDKLDLDVPPPPPIANGAPAPVTIPVVSAPEEATTAPEVVSAPEETPEGVAAAETTLPPSEPADDSVPVAPEGKSEGEDSVGQPHPAEQITGKKVIKPLNDLSKKPDINELLAKEEQRAAVENPVANTVIKPLPDNSTNQTPSAPSSAKHDDIAL